MQHNSKKSGFTLVELLAVVVILGIIMMISIPAVTRWIDRSKSESKESMKQTLVMATQSYAQANKEVLPKVIGQTTTIDAQSLKDNQYLKEELQDANKKSCMSSYVKVYKSDKNKYTYTPYLMCEGDTAPAENASVTPSISIGFSGSKSGSNIQNVDTSSFKVTISGGRKGEKDLGIDGYSYSISVKYTDNANEKSVEIYNSGSLNGGGKPSIVLEKSLEEYTDITKVNEFIVTVKAYNSDGGYKEQTTSSLYKDTTPPTCGEIEGQAADDSWIKQKGKSRTISVLCSDNEDGSGCVKEKFTNTFDTEMEYGTIQISDNAGNTTDCRVRVHIDWTAPSFTATAYKYTGNLDVPGEKVSEALTVSHSTANHTVTMVSNYKGTVNGWLNKANFSKGIEYMITTQDNIRLDDGKLYYNKSRIWSEGTQYDTLQSGETRSFSATDNTFKFKVEEEGLRKAKYVVRDKAGNEVTMYFLAKIDRTNPTCSTKKSHLNTTDGVNVTITCNDGESKCSSNNTLTYTGQKRSTSYSVKDNAGNSNSCGVTVFEQRQKRTRSCTGGKSCSAAGCRSHTWSCAAGSCYQSANQYSSCYTNTSCVNKCTSYNTSISKCGCATYSSWSGWTNCSSCSGNDTTDCRSLYY